LRINDVFYKLFFSRGLISSFFYNFFQFLLNEFQLWEQTPPTDGEWKISFSSLTVTIDVSISASFLKNEN